MKEFIYFFKHKNISGIKIGRASGFSVQERFKCFKTYSPFGAEIIGFFESDNAVFKEKELHKQFSSLRMHGEFFDISVDIALSIINENSLQELNNIVTEWVSDPSNNKDKLLQIMQKSNVSKSNPVTDFISKNITPGDYTDLFMTEKEITLMFKTNFGKRIGIYLTKAGFESTIRRVNGKPKRGFLVKIL